MPTSVSPAVTPVMATVVVVPGVAVLKRTRLGPAASSAMAGKPPRSFWIASPCTAVVPLPTLPMNVPAPVTRLMLYRPVVPPTFRMAKAEPVATGVPLRRGVHARRDVEAVEPGEVEADARPDRRRQARAGVLQVERVARRVDRVQRGGRGVGLVVGVGRAVGGRRAAVEGRGVRHHQPGVRVDGEALAGAGDDADAVHQRVEVEPEPGRRQGRIGHRRGGCYAAGRPDRCRDSGAGRDVVQRPGAGGGHAQRVQVAVLRAEVDANQRLTRVDSGDEQIRQDSAGSAGGETDEVVVAGSVTKKVQTRSCRHARRW